MTMKDVVYGLNRIGVVSTENLHARHDLDSRITNGDEVGGVRCQYVVLKRDLLNVEDAVDWMLASSRQSRSPRRISIDPRRPA